MRGGIDFQVNRLFIDSGIFTPRVSKHLKKIEARHCFGACTQSEIGRHLTIFSYDTAETYKDVWHQFARWAKTELGLNHIERTDAGHVGAYLQYRREQGGQWSTFKKIASALKKFELALKMYAEKTGSGNKYDFARAIREVAKVASEELEHGKFTTRAYPDPDRLINELPSIAFMIKANLQYEGGARISETYIKQDQLQGISEHGQGVICLKGYNAKGGKVRNIYVSQWTYVSLKNHIEQYGRFDINDRSYGYALARAASNSGQPYTGPHGLRWNFAQDQMRSLQSCGATYELALQAVSLEMGHVRPEITEWYLR